MSKDHLFPQFWTPTEIDRRHDWQCQHRHNGLVHANCYNIAHDLKERVCYLDTEFYVGKNNWGKLCGDWGAILCWVIGDGEGNYWSDEATPKEAAAFEDKRIVESCIARLRQFDRVITHFGDRCDLPLLRTRAIINGSDFPAYGALKSTDVWKIAKTKLCISSNSQKTLAKVINGKTEKTSVEAEIWLGAIRGNKKCLATIIDHCHRDVRDLERNAKALAKYVKLSSTSI
jgi:hypothetical protein